MDIHAGNEVISDVNVFSERVWHMGTSRPAMRIQLNGALNAAQLAALAKEPWDIYDGGELVGRHSGYNALISHEMVMAAVTDAETELNAAHDAALQAKHEADNIAHIVETDIASLKEQGAQLTKRLAAISPGNEFLEGCIMELAGKIYE